MSQAIMFLQDFKLGHYMKIPPKSMFIVHLVGTIVASSVYFATSWWLLTTVKYICDPSKLPEGSPWTCPGTMFSTTLQSYGECRNFCNFVVYRKFKGWWARHNYILSAGLDAGVAFMAILCYFFLQIKDINGPQWWGMDADDHCPLAGCPTAPGVKVDGCPVVN
ncbi:putative oligopeptide transporter, OPT superfamily [Helianthus annuus]|nr:putative oligopeptide transporter, OPT superfamily [Helianthus annuus]